MGQESSTLVDENTPTQTLKDRSLGSIAKLIKDGRIRKIVVMASPALHVLDYLLQIAH